MSIGFREILLVLLLALLLFGARRLPELAKSLGRSLQEFRKGMKDVTDEQNGSDDDFKNKADKRTGCNRITLITWNSCGGC